MIMLNLEQVSDYFLAYNNFGSSSLFIPISSPFMNVSTLCNMLFFIIPRKCIVTDVANCALALLIKHCNKIQRVYLSWRAHVVNHIYHI